MRTKRLSFSIDVKLFFIDFLNRTELSKIKEKIFSGTLQVSKCECCFEIIQVEYFIYLKP